MSKAQADTLCLSVFQVFSGRMMKMLDSSVGQLWLLLLLPLISQQAPATSQWDYETNDPAKWPAAFKRWCGDRFQSPIGLQFSQSLYDTDLPAYAIAEDATGLAGRKFQAFNDGHKVGIGFSSAAVNISVPGHPGSCYRPDSIHWHWGADDTRGSEHWLEGRQYPMEGHMVMWNCQLYSSYSQAFDGFDGLAVLGILYEPDSSVTAYSQPLAALMGLLATEPRLQQCANCHNSSFEPPLIDMDAFRIEDTLPADRSQYYLYSGSLTTPDCRENVMWTVYRQSVRLPPSVLSSLRSLKYPDGSAMVNNFRLPVALNPASPFGARRLVVRSFNTGGPDVLPSSAGWLRAKPWFGIVVAMAVAMGPFGLEF